MLAGNLTDFSIDDVVRLLASAKKSGALRVDAPRGEARVWFHAGDVMYAAADVRRCPLGTRLMAAGHLADEDARQVLQGCDSPVDAARALVFSDLVAPDVIQTFLREQTAGAVAHLMRLEAGEFSFDNDDAGDWPAPVYAADQVLAEARQRMERWDTVAAGLPAADVRLRLVPVLAGDEVTLTRDQWALLALVNGRRTVGELVDVSGDHAAGEGLGGLLASGLIQPRPLDDEDPVEALGDAGPPTHHVPGTEPAAVDASVTPLAAGTVGPLRARDEDVVDVKQMARELASLVHGDASTWRGSPRRRDEAPAAARPARPRPLPDLPPDPLASETNERTAPRPLARDQGVDRSVLLRLIDGVKGV